MPWPFELEFMQRALVAGLVVGVSAPLIGAFLVQRRMALMGDGVGHVAFAGVAGGLLADVWPVWTALVAAIAGALIVERLRSRRTASGDLALALCFYSGIAGGVVLLGMADSLDASVFAYLFGSILTVSTGDMWVVVGLGAVIVAAVTWAGRALFATVIDEEAARVAGLPVDALNAALAVLTAVTVVAAMRVVGILLVAALMVMPVAAAQLVARSFRTTLLWAMAIGVGSVVAGLTGARQWDLAPGGSIVLVAAAVFAVVAVAGRGRRSAAPAARSVHSG